MAVRQRVHRVERDLVSVTDVGRAVGVAPAEVLVVSRARHGRAENRETREVPALVALQMYLVPLPAAVERDVRILEQQRVPRRGAGRRDRPRVRAERRVRLTTRGAS